MLILLKLKKLKKKQTIQLLIKWYSYFISKWSRKIAEAKINKGQLEVDGKAVTTISVNGKDQLPVAINEKGQLEVNGQAITNVNVNGKDQLTLARNEKGNQK